jgi:hypothetical protein
LFGSIKKRKTAALCGDAAKELLLAYKSTLPCIFIISIGNFIKNFGFGSFRTKLLQFLSRLIKSSHKPIEA